MLLLRGSFGTKIAEDVLDRYLQLQWDIAAEEDVSTSDMFFLLDSVRRSHRQHQDTKDDAAEPPDVGELPDPDQTAGEDGPAPSPSEDVSRAPSPASDVSGAEAGPVRRRLVLQSEEVLFLSHALGCVRVTTPSGAELAGERLYRHLAEECGDRHLAARYAAYLDLRGRGWVVRDGLQSGADFVLYRRGPAFYHAALVVTIQVVCADTGRLRPERCLRQADWLYTAGLCRAAEQTAKDVLLVRLLWPSDLGRPADLGYLRRVGVQHTLVRRWTPGRPARTDS
ncbi:tRNA-splicing endonuclease subunit Sen2-like isoform X2 [Amphibalanus amphitrite]|uniref:tRNA-splicing endonuclease subunit Sen2-like isoform X2 n=1 Tax=Amphibalanus amphitrite TaxID=1232801 RepID=UPI001C8FDDBE|nr:tRNA-splicing endonuclease subunit Sen2-like isoform X2 [Amphibalanus amphitrite]